MTERISHEEARGGLRAYVVNPLYRDLLERYITQQQALEADTVSRAEHERHVSDLDECLQTEKRARIEAEAQLTALQAEHDLQRHTLCNLLELNSDAPWDRVLADVGDALATERARTEEAERIAAEATGVAMGLQRKLAAANARAGRLEDMLRKAVPVWSTWRVDVDALLALSTAPQASTEQDSYWLVEQTQAQAPTYLLTDKPEAWTTDVHAALRYEKEEHAKDVIPLLDAAGDEYPSPLVRAREHIDVPAPAYQARPVSQVAQASTEQASPSPAVGEEKPTCAVTAGASACGLEAEWFHVAGKFWACAKCFREYPPEVRGKEFVHKSALGHARPSPSPQVAQAAASGNRLRHETINENERCPGCGSDALDDIEGPLLQSGCCRDPWHKQPADPTPAGPGGTERWVPKVHDVVRGSARKPRGCFEGSGVIVEIFDASTLPIHVKWDNGSRGNYAQVELEPLPDPTPAEPQGEADRRLEGK